jgi:chromosome segregation ATPase
MAPADLEGLRAENARLAAEMASMKKKMMLAMKKQSAEVKLAQHRAEAAEAALAAASNGSLDAVDSHSGNEGASSEVGSRLSLDASLGRAASEVSDDGGGVRNSGDFETSAEKDYLEEREALASEARRNAEEREKLDAEREALASEARRNAEEGEKLEAEREALTADARRSAEDKEKLEAEFRDSKLASDQILAQLMEKNKSLESQLEEITRIRVEASGEGGSSGSEGARVSENVDTLSNSLLEQQVKEANEKIQRLEAELKERVESLQAAEATALDAKNARPLGTSDLSSKLGKVNKQLEEEISKYTELDAKFNRLLKRSKQRIQEVQKEKDDLEVQFKALEVKATEALARQTALQADLNATRNQAGDAIRNLDSERQQLNTALRRARQDIDEMQQVLGAKERELNETSNLVFEKDQQLTELAEKLKEAETNQEVAILGLKETYQKVVENYEQQLAEAAKDRIKGDEALTALQAQLADKESKLAEVEAASSGELVRLGAMLDAARGDIHRLLSEHEKERETEREDHKATVSLLTNKLEASELLLRQVEMAAGSRRSQLESELEGCRQILSATQVELATARAETKLQAQELAAYKVRAHALLQRKEAALQAAQDSSTMAALESALEEAKAQAAAATTSRDQAVRRLDATVADYQRELNAQAGVLEEARLHIRELATQLELSKALVKSQQVDYERRLHQAEEALSSRPEVPPATTSPVNEGLKSELTALRTAEKNLKGEFEAYKEMTDSMMASKDEEIMRLVEEKNSLQKHLSQKAPNDVVDRSATSSPPPPVAEQQILTLARLQAQKEEEVARCLRHIEALQEEIKELEQENRLRVHQITILKEEYQNSERNQKRSGVDMTYVKNVILKLLETGEVEALLPVIAMLLQFSPDELRRCQEAYRMQAVAEVPLSGAAAVVDAATSAPRSLLSRFTLS